MLILCHRELPRVSELCAWLCQMLGRTYKLFVAAGGIRALYHRSMSLNLPHRRSSGSAGAGRGSLRHGSPAHKSARKVELSEGAPGEAEPLRPQSSTELPDCPESGQGLGSAARAPSRSSLKMSRQVCPVHRACMCVASHHTRQAPMTVALTIDSANVICILGSHYDGQVMSC